MELEINRQEDHRRLNDWGLVLRGLREDRD